MMITINLDTEKAKFLKKILEKVNQGRSEFTRPAGNGAREYLVSLEEIHIFDEVLIAAIDGISRGIEKDFQENEAWMHKELMGAVRQSGCATGYRTDHDIDDFKESLQRGIKTVSDGLREPESLIEDKGLPPLGHDRPMPPVKKPKPPKGRMKKF